ncbi:hypothetical protein I203_103284 [Kwoniella mangroviensis CBS 8507]|uniref:uncharacterized protein n=1 Tax=Kwoniella mangroviensis CBS 8507 TaxID=1296122 RepID=UPI00080CE593|nr:uncharacterized protein I203_05992 [Kwoniella mangroviensis CBS 8507]OCF64748.1 hypothetical protein I203_05992 [Kwoniella mangroviensis CBS 8507]
MLLPSSFPTLKRSTSPKQFYRRFLQHLQLLPDPHIWSILIPCFRKLLKQSSDGFTGDDATYKSASEMIPAEESSRAASERVKQWKRERALKRAERELQRLRAAVACHPHALTRLIEEAYGQRGVIRHDLLKVISSPYSVNPHFDPLPPPLQPLKPPPPAPSEAQPRARKAMPPCRVRAELRRSIERDWSMVKPPLLLSFTALDKQDIYMGSNGWDRRAVENLRLLSTGYDSSRTDQLNKLDFSSLQPHIRRLFPVKRVPRLREPSFAPPRPKATRQNPNIWGFARQLDWRLLSRTYRRFWDGLVWVRPIKVGHQDRWTKCSYEETKNPPEVVLAGPDKQGLKAKKSSKKRNNTPRIEPDRWTEATEDDMKFFNLRSGCE